MPILSSVVASDSQIISIKYSLYNEQFSNISAYAYPVAVGEGVVISTSGATGGEATENGTFSINVSKTQLVNAGIKYSGIILLELNTVKEGVTFSSYSAILIGEEVDCCLADKMYDAVGCDCDDDDCNESLKDAQKMFLLKKSAEFGLKGLNNNQGPDTITLQKVIADSQSKYNKALELCSSGCGCNNSSSVSSGAGASSSTGSY